MDTDQINALEEEVKGCNTITIAANYLFLKTGDQGFSYDCCFLWATTILYPNLRPWANGLANKMKAIDNTRLT